MIGRVPALTVAVRAVGCPSNVGPLLAAARPEGHAASLLQPALDADEGRPHVELPVDAQRGNLRAVEPLQLVTLSCG